MTTARDTAPPSGGGSADTITITSTLSSEYLRQWTPSISPSPLPTPENADAQAPSPVRSPFEGDPKIIFAMAQPSGVTEEGLIASLKDKVGATHVDIEDMSGKLQHILPTSFHPAHLAAPFTQAVIRTITLQIGQKLTHL